MRGAILYWEIFISFTMLQKATLKNKPYKKFAYATVNSSIRALRVV